MHEVKANLLNNIRDFLGKVFHWNEMPTVFWQVQGVIHLESSSPKVLVVSMCEPSQEAHIPIGLFLDSIQYQHIHVHD